MIAAVILAAGHSSRVGRSKALLPHRDGGTSLVRHAITQAKSAGLKTVIVVGREGDAELEREVAVAGGTFIANPEPDRGQLSSLLAALDALGSDELIVDGVLVLPVDVPLVSGGVLRAVVLAAEGTAAPIVRAAHHGVHGHPVVFKREIFDELRAADPALGAKAVVRADPARVVDVEVNDPAVLADVDTPADYERLFGRPLPETDLPR